MPIEIRQFACLSDNYGFLVRDEQSGLVAAIDAPDPKAVLEALGGWTLAMVLNTHWHPDHAGGDAALKAATGAKIIAPAEVVRTTAVDRVVSDGDVVELGETRFEVMATGGHTLGHVSYYDEKDAVVFVGDTLFAMGCGRLFEGTPEQMWTSLSRLSNLPPETKVYCAHEYTAANAQFALSLDDDPAVAVRAKAIFAARARGVPTVPTTIGLERETNPFLRAEGLAHRLARDGAQAALAPAAAFAAVRAAKDVFRSAPS
jgi:hydroxyacylglutathione hydrolase